MSNNQGEVMEQIQGQQTKASQFTACHTKHECLPQKKLQALHKWTHESKLRMEKI